MAADPDGKFTYKISDDLPEETLSPEEFKEHDKEVMSFGFEINEAFLYRDPMLERYLRNLLLPRKKQRLKRRI